MASDAARHRRDRTDAVAQVRAPKSWHVRENKGLRTARQVDWSTLERAVGVETGDELRAKQLATARAQFRADLERSRKPIAAAPVNVGVPKMTVSLYQSSASGSREIVVQTNAQSLDVFIAGLADALHSALLALADERTAAAWIIAATLKNSFPVAFAIAGYKAEKVSESKLLTCGVAALDASELISQSKV